MKKSVDRGARRGGARRPGGRGSERDELCARARSGTSSCSPACRETTGFTATGTAAAVGAAVTAAGGTVANDLSQQIGVLVVESSVATLRVGALGVRARRRRSARTSVQGPAGRRARSRPPIPLEALQWDMQQIRAPQAHDIQAGSRSVDVGILDSGIDGNHLDFASTARGSNVDCARGRNSVSFLPGGPGVGTPDPCVDNQFHGTHVAGTIAAQANGIGVVGVAPNVTLVPVKVCDASGYCYASAVVDGITYAGDIKLDVINMSFFVDDDEFQESTEFKCNSTTRCSARSGRRSSGRSSTPAARASTPVAALGNSDEDLAHPSAAERGRLRGRAGRDAGVIGVSALGRQTREGGLLELRHRRERRVRSGRQRHDRRLHDDDPLDDPRRRATAASRARRWPRRTRPASRR